MSLQLTVSSYLWIRLYLKPPITQVAFTAEGENGRRVVRPNLLFLRIVAHTHTNVIVASSTGIRMSQGSVE